MHNFGKPYIFISIPTITVSTIILNDGLTYFAGWTHGSDSYKHGSSDYFQQQISIIYCNTKFLADYRRILADGMLNLARTPH